MKTGWMDSQIWHGITRDNVAVQVDAVLYYRAAHPV
jgi:regulator of protease activity HflC (stomatin/prohibitin superfamily)